MTQTRALMMHEGGMKPQVQATMRVIKGELCISYGGLELAGVSYSYSINRVNENKWRIYQSHWVAYNSLSVKVRERVTLYYGDVMVYYLRMVAIQGMEQCRTDADWIYFDELKRYGNDKLLGLTESSAWLRWLSPLAQKRMPSGMLLPDEALPLLNTVCILNTVCGILKERDIYGLRIFNHRRLLEKVKAWAVEGHDCLISNYFENDNNQRLPEWAKKRIFDLYANSEGKPKFNAIRKVLNSELAERNVRYGKDNKLVQVSEIRLRQIITDNKLLVIAKRDGVVVAQQATYTNVLGRGYKGANQLWSVDGTTIQLWTEVAGKLQKVGYMVIVIDGWSKAIIGWAISKTETKELVQKAVRSALKTSGGYAADWFNCDHGAANSSAEVKAMITGMNSRGLVSQPYRPNGKPVEKQIGVLEQDVMAYMGNFTGGNRTVRKQDSLENVDSIKALWKAGKLPDLEGGVRQFAVAIGVYNNTEVKGETRINKYKRGLAENNIGKALSETMLAELFWVKRRDRSKYENDGIVIEIEGKKHYFEVERKRGVEDSDWKKANFGSRFWIRYDPDDLSAIHLYDDADKWVARANAKYAFAKVPDSDHPEERALLLERWADRENLTADSITDMDNIRAEMEDMGLQEGNFQLFKKDEIAAIEESELLIPVMMGASKSPAQKPSKRVSKYGDDGDLKVIL